MRATGKRLGSILLALAMLLSLLPVTALAVPEGRVVLPEGVTEESFTGDAVIYYNGSYYDSFDEALAVANADQSEGPAVFYCKPGADMGEQTHMHVKRSLTVYGNGAYISGGEHDFELDTYQDNGEEGSCLTGDVTLTLYSLDGAAVWSQRNSTYTLNLYLEDCRYMNRVYLSGTSGANNITLKDCTFDSEKWVSSCTIYSNAPGNILVEGCTFTGVQEPINLNNKAAPGTTQTITVKDCTFTNCSTTDICIKDVTWAAPIRVVSSAGAASNLTVEECTFTAEGGKEYCNGHILLGDGRVNENSYPVSASIVNTDALVQIQNPGDRTADRNSARELQVTADQGAQVTNAAVKNETTGAAYLSLESAWDDVQTGEVLTLLADADDVSDLYTMGKAVSVNLDGHDVTFGETCGFVVNGGGLNLTGAGKVIASNPNSGYSTIQVNGSSSDIAGYSTLTVGEQVTLVNTAGKFAVGVLPASGASAANGVVVDFAGRIETAAGITINGTVTDNGPNMPQIILRGTAVINSDGTALYAAGCGRWIIQGGSITSTTTAMEIRAGQAEIQAGTLKSTAEQFQCDPNGNGTTTIGAALAIAQHTTKRDISVTITGGTLEGLRAINESNPQGNDPAPQVALSVTGGTFRGEIAAADVNGFVSGGTFSQAVPEEYCALGFQPVDNGDGTYGVEMAALTGSGTQKDPYVIADGAALATFRDMVNSGNSFAGQYVALGGDIDLTGGASWTPIGDGVRDGSGYTGSAFRGSFDGAGKTITGLTITGSAPSEDSAMGLFGVVDGGTVKNLTLTGVNIDVENGECVGAAVGLMVNGASVSGVTVGAQGGTDRVSAVRGLGGVVGRMTVRGTIENCVNYAQIEGTSATSGNVGGIVGAAYYTAESGEMSITGCSNYGPVSNLCMGVGGIAGLSAANVADCANSGAISGNGTSIGGIVGEQQNAGSITGCENTARITNGSQTSTGTGGYGTGGIVGWVRYNGSDTDYPRKEIIAVTGNINRGAIDGGNDGGGIIGTLYNAGEVTGNENYASAIEGVTFAAGIVGNLQSTETPTGGIPKNDIQVWNNVSTTALEAITGNCRALYAYQNQTGEPDVAVEDNSAAWEAMAGGTQYAVLTRAIAEADGAAVSLLANGVTAAISAPATILKNGRTAQLTAGAGYALMETEEAYLIYAAPADEETYTVEYRLERLDQSGFETEDTLADVEADGLGETFQKSYEGFTLAGVVYDEDSGTYAVRYTRSSYTVIWDVDGAVTEVTLLYGAEITPPADPVKQGYTFTGWAGYTDGMTMPAENVTFTAQWRSNASGGGGVATYAVNLPQTANGTVTVNPKLASQATQVTVTVKPDGGYELSSLTVTGTSGAVEVAKVSDTQYTFKMPGCAVTVAVVFQLQGEGGEDVTGLPFTDVAENAWYYEAVEFVYSEGMMNGTGGSTFEPATNLSRAMIAQVLFNQEGNIQVNYLLPFTDVAAGLWYTEAVRWAAAEKIVTGYDNGTFGPEDNLTREQMAAILYRYAQYKGYDTTQGGMAVREFADYGQISDWALEAMTWAVNAGVLSGKDGGVLDPQGITTRAEVAQILMNFSNAFVK